MKSVMLTANKTQISLNEKVDKVKSKAAQPAPKRPSLDNESKPTPLDFDEFIPWACLQYQAVQTVTVTRIYQEDYVKAQVRRASSRSAKSVKTKLSGSHDTDEPKDSGGAVPVDLDSINIKAYYSLLGYLQAVSIVGCPFNIDKAVIQVISMTIPYHPTLSKLTICKGGLTASLLVQIGKLLPQSNLTDIRLDDTNVPQKNYTVLLQNGTKLRNLSLNRCHLGDVVCIEIAKSIDTDTSCSSLRILELSSNMISDKGAEALAKALRRNRQLMHLNFSGNHITDKGAASILNSLMEFSLTYDEIFEMKRKRLEIYRKKIALYDEWLIDLKIARYRADGQVKSSVRSRSLKSNASSKPKTSVPKKSPHKKSPVSETLLHNSGDGMKHTPKVEYSYPELAQKAEEALGEVHEAFDSDHIIYKNQYYYCVGNMFLCSLNLAYNNLEFSSVQKIKSVLEYQSELKRPPGTTGLMRINFEGNSVPKYCEDYVHIEILLQNAINGQLPKANSIQKKKGTAQRKPTSAVFH